MEMLIYIVAVLLIVCIFYIRHIENFDKSPKDKLLYKYQAKEYFMTQSESDFFRMLVDVVGDRFYIFPQAHLSSILDEKITGQNWNAAFSHINGKSVDYVLCDKITLKPAYAVELDDYTHHSASRQERDKEVERIFKAAGIPLVRFNDYKSFKEDSIARQFFEANNSV
jgi:hypothetical protein